VKGLVLRRKPSQIANALAAYIIRIAMYLAMRLTMDKYFCYPPFALG